MQQIIMKENEAGQRLDKMLSKYMKAAPKSFLYKMLRKKNITLNGRRAVGNEMLKAGDEVTLFLSDETIGKFSDSGRVQLTEEALSILYEDENILLIDKPAGMLSQKATETDVSVVEHVISHLLRTGQLTEEALRTFRPSVCNRLDRNTSGIIAAGKSLKGLQELSRMFKDRSLGKYYLCLVVGRVEGPSSIRGYLTKDKKTNRVRITAAKAEDGTAIETQYRPLKSGFGVTLLEVHLITGKPHQIRAHLASISHPILGDYKYGDKKSNDRYRIRYGLNHQLLNAHRIVFPKLEGILSNLSEKEFTAALPEDFRKIAEDEGVL